jgi:hypothetical protein
LAARGIGYFVVSGSASIAFYDDCLLRGGVVERGPNAVRYPEGDSVTLTPRANPGWRFHHWEGDLTGDNTPATITMSADKTVIPVFVPDIDLRADINDDGIIDATDDTLEDQGDGEYMRVEDYQDNGAGEAEYELNPVAGLAPLDLPGNRPTYLRSDDVQKLEILRADGLFLEAGQIEIQVVGSPGEINLLYSQCPDDRIAIPYECGAGRLFPEDVYLWADPSSISGQVTARAALIWRSPAGNTVELDSMMLTIVPEIGNNGFFKAGFDYVSENETNFFTGMFLFSSQSLNGWFGWEGYRVTILDNRRTDFEIVMRSDAADGDYGSIQEVVEEESASTLIINGSYFQKMDDGSRRPVGYIIKQGTLDPSSTESNWGSNEYFFEQEESGGSQIHLSRNAPLLYKNNEVFPRPIPLDMADLRGVTSDSYTVMGGLHDNFADDWEKKANLIGTAEGGSILFHAMTTGKWLDTKDGRKLEAVDKLRASAKDTVNIAQLDGGGSVGLVLRDENGVAFSYFGGRHVRIFGQEPIGVISYLVFHTQN